MKKQTTSAPRGGLYAQKVATEKTTTTTETPKRGPGRPPKAKPEPTAETTKPSRKARIRELYVSAVPMMKSQIVDQLIAEKYGTAEGRENLKRAVDNEASYMRGDKLNPRWLPEQRAAV